MAQLVPLPYSQGRSTCYSDRMHDFSVTIPTFIKKLTNINRCLTDPANRCLTNV